MGAETTYYLTRETALAIIYARLYTFSDEKLEELLEELPESVLRNYRVTPWEPEADERLIIRTPADF